MSVNLASALERCSGDTELLGQVVADADAQIFTSKKLLTYIL